MNNTTDPKTKNMRTILRHGLLSGMLVSILSLFTIKSTTPGDLGHEEFRSDNQADDDVLKSDIKIFSDTAALLVKEKKVAGCEILILKDQKIFLHEVHGWSDIEREIPLQKGSLYRIRSMTKPFIGTAILMLVEQGKLALDHPVSTYLPSFKNGRSGSITIQHLIEHTSGFRQDGYPAGYWHCSSLRNAVDLLGESGPPDSPGTAYRYSDKNTATMGAIIAEITGEPVEHFLQCNIFDPLEMKDTYSHFSPEYPWAACMNSTYRLQGGRFHKYWDNTRPQGRPFFRASGGLYTTVFDYARFLQVWSNFGNHSSGRLLAEATVRRALNIQPPNHDYGFHWEIYDSFYEGEGLPPFGHSGSDGTLALSIPDKDIQVLWFTQTRGNPTIRHDILPLVESIFIYSFSLNP